MGRFSGSHTFRDLPPAKCLTDTFLLRRGNVDPAETKKLVGSHCLHLNRH